MPVNVSKHLGKTALLRTLTDTQCSLWSQQIDSVQPFSGKPNLKTRLRRVTLTPCTRKTLNILFCPYLDCQNSTTSSKWSRTANIYSSLAEGAGFASLSNLAEHVSAIFQVQFYSIFLEFCPNMVFPSQSISKPRERAGHGDKPVAPATSGAEVQAIRWGQFCN